MEENKFRIRVNIVIVSTVTHFNTARYPEPSKQDLLKASYSFRVKLTSLLLNTTHMENPKLQVATTEFNYDQWPEEISLPDVSTNKRA